MNYNLNSKLNYILSKSLSDLNYIQIAFKYDFYQNVYSIEIQISSKCKLHPNTNCIQIQIESKCKLYPNTNCIQIWFL